jgi:hypothetical protein
MIHPEDPKIYDTQYQEGSITILELFSGLIYCARFVPITEIVKVLMPDELVKFRQRVHQLAKIKSDSDIVRVNNPPPWTSKEVAKIEAYFDEMEQPPKWHLTS